MGLRFRKSIKLGGARINFSKSGIGYSFGTKGARVTKKAGGGTRTTLSIPGTGISYVEDSKQAKRKASGKRSVKAGPGSPDGTINKTWLWIVGWICVFPLPLTILLLRKKDMKAPVKYGIIALSWLVYLLIGLTAGGSNQNNAVSRQMPVQTVDTAADITAISLNKAGTLTLKAGEKVEAGPASVTVGSTYGFSPEQVVFVSEDSDIAAIRFTKASLVTNLGFEIEAVSPGETIVYAKSADGSVVSEKLKIIVPEPVLVKEISLEGNKTELVLGESTELAAKISPDDAENKTISWSSSDEAVASVDQNGNVVAKAGGTAVITATSANDVTASMELTVDGSKRRMRLRVSHSQQNDVNIGHEWNYNTQVNGELAAKMYVLSAGETINYYAQFRESDDNPDVGEASASHTVTEEDLMNGISVSMDLYVTENGGRNSGKSAHFIVTYEYTAM